MKILKAETLQLSSWKDLSFNKTGTQYIDSSSTGLLFLYSHSSLLFCAGKLMFLHLGTKYTVMSYKKLLPAFIALFFSSFSFSQILFTIADGGNKKASVSERIGITDVTIHYDRPAVKGREGKIWGELVPKGFTDQGFGTSKAAPWRAGANENTTISFSSEVMLEGKTLPAGTYGLFIALGDGDAKIIISNNSTSWGSFFYDPKEDALRVTVKTVALAESVF